MGVYFASLIGKLPLRFSFAVIAPVLTFLLRHVARYRVKYVQTNIAEAFSDRSKQEQHKILVDYYRYLGQLIVEILHTPFIDKDQLAKNFEVENVELIDKAIADGRSIVVAACHQGNWEWLLGSVSLSSRSTLEIIYKPLHNKKFDGFFKQMRERFGLLMVPHKKALDHFLERDDSFVLGLLADQAPLPKRRKFWSTMLGRDTAFPIGLETFAKDANAVVVYIDIQRPKPGKYKAVLSVLYDGDYNEATPTPVTHAYADACTRSIRAQPETWLWSNRRWRYTKAEDPRLAE